MTLSEISIRRPVFAAMLIGALVVLGAVSYPRLDLRLFPKADLPLVTITTRLPGASAETVERELTQPLEEAVNVIDGIEALDSISSDSLSRIVVRFEVSQDPFARAQDVRDKVAAALGNLPNDAEAPVVERFDPESQAMLAVLFSGTDSIRSLTELVDKSVKPALERLPGVGSVSLVGGRKREVRIWIDPLRMAGYGLAVDDLLDALEREHVEIPGGRIETNRWEYSVKTRGKLTEPSQFGAIIVSQRGGRSVRMRDVARIEDGMEEQRTLARLDGRPGVSLLVRRQSGSNVVAVARRVKAELVEIGAGLPEGVSFRVTRDKSRFVEASVRGVTENLFWGSLLATAVVLAFLRSGRSTIIAGLAIPASLLGSFAALYFFDITLNQMTLLGLSLSIGMLIDDAIVVVENIYRHIESGKTPVVAAIDASQEIGLAVVATTLAICAVFVPIVFMDGAVMMFLREFGLVVTFAVCVSTLVALTLVPMLSSRYLGVRKRHGAAWTQLENAFVALERGYRRALQWGLEHRLAVVLIAFASTGLGVVLATSIPIEFVPEGDQSEFNVFVDMPVGTPLPKTTAVVQRIEEIVAAHPEVVTVFATVGGGAREQVDEASLYVELRHKSQRRQHPQKQIMEDIRRHIAAAQLPLSTFSVAKVPDIEVAGDLGYGMTYSIRGPELRILEGLADQLSAHMRSKPGFADVSSSFEKGKPEIALDIERERAADLGVPAAQIGRTISALLAGREVTQFEEGGERYAVRVQLEQRYRDDPLELGLLNIRAGDGQLIPFSNLVTSTIQSGPVEITREKRARVIRVNANLTGVALGDASAEVQRFVDTIELPHGYTIEKGGFSKSMEETMDNIAFGFGLTLIAMYMILASQFNSLVHPLTIMLSAPLSFIGAFAGLFVSGLYFGMLGQIGLLMLMGLVMKNGILLVDYTNKLREQGRGLREAVLEAGPTRLRPVLMTTTSTIFGMAPLAFGSGDGSEIQNSMGVIVMGGLVTSTALTLIVVPVVYTLIDDAQGLLWRVFGIGPRATQAELSAIANR